MYTDVVYTCCNKPMVKGEMLSTDIPSKNGWRVGNKVIAQHKSSGKLVECWKCSVCGKSKS